jgi:6-pyruvoyltetrahydropterin/6-carboxytetrahydropterin synthase
MFTVVVEEEFSAVHRVRLADGTVEAPHGHDWVVRAHFARLSLDDSGMVIDFGEARAALRSIIEQFHGCDLNDCAGLAGASPTAEVLARLVLERLLSAGLGAVCRVEVTEAPGCVASFERPARLSGQAAEDPPPA